MHAVLGRILFFISYLYIIYSFRCRKLSINLKIVFPYVMVFPDIKGEGGWIRSNRDLVFPYIELLNKIGQHYYLTQLMALVT
jgi:hypothetical protein